MLPFWIALQFLSSLPIRLPGMPQPQELGRSLLFYPLVGLLFGLLLWGLNTLLLGAPLLLHAALLLTAWVLLSGGLHLDGLADSADAWLGGFGDRERTLTIMKDPRSGPIAVVTLAGAAAQVHCPGGLDRAAQRCGIDSCAVDRARFAAGVVPHNALCACRGLGQALADHLPRIVGQQVLILTGLACVLIGGFSGGIAVLLAAICFMGLRQVMINRLGGTTGDTAGALLELLEVAVLIGLAL